MDFFDAPPPEANPDQFFPTLSSEPTSFDGFGSPAPQTFEQPADNGFSSFGFEQPSATQSFGFEEQPSAPQSFGFEEQPSAPQSFGFEEPAALEFAPAPIVEEAPAPSPVDALKALSSGPSFSAPAPSEKASVLNQYEEEHRKFIQEKVANAENKLRDVRDAAQGEVAKFLADREANLQRIKKENRVHNESLRDVPPADDGSAWANVSNLVNLKESDHTKERMRKVLISLQKH
eukprot:CAMPEP_0184349166 /NCGR_PEP_ID=MMETSP1089-20130417/32215_1 /TAXON_ID=38269 ORGANISM="Gloeochaete wittrockiana, Strain SAG46.84" /NCGR_SAMPLE_ID=MMETSP1089 /ASSEMBLY_ACC=CAM_ASM_000445 /LENGTH=232 /DNA_ID=CAMNT_0026681255 /DNA_START=91 /DNA_END=789 /DNA_ORIENTATION=-